MSITYSVEISDALTAYITDELMGQEALVLDFSGSRFHIAALCKDDAAMLSDLICQWFKRCQRDMGGAKDA